MTAAKSMLPGQLQNTGKMQFFSSLVKVYGFNFSEY
jgi:hypothetical protein